ncbi:MAG: hypothetical protein V3T17_11025 [Pseudomonadales bacterium]
MLQSTELSDRYCSDYPGKSYLHLLNESGLRLGANLSVGCFGSLSFLMISSATFREMLAVAKLGVDLESVERFF